MVTCSNVLQLMHAASKYMIPQFYKSDCLRRFLDENLQVINVCTFLDHAVTYEVPNLIALCVHFIAAKADEVFQTDGFLALSKGALGLILDSPCLRCNDETRVFQTCERWVQHSKTMLADDIQTNSNSDGTLISSRDLIGKNLYKIRKMLESSMIALSSFFFQVKESDYDTISMI